MITGLYNWYYEEEYLLARQQLDFFENKLNCIDKDTCNDINKAYRKRRIELVIRCIKYTYNL
jgi:hypothetical protein